MYGLFYASFQLRKRHGPDLKNAIPCFEIWGRNVGGKIYDGVNCIIRYNVLNNTVELSPSLEANRLSASQEIRSILWNPNVQYRIHISHHLSLRWAKSTQSMPRLSRFSIS